MKIKRSKIILDTNIWISFLIRNGYKELEDILLSDTTTLLFSNELFNEFLEVVKRPKFRCYFSVEDTELLTD